MKSFSIPIISSKLEKNTDQVLAEAEINGIELEYLWPKYAGRSLFTGVFAAAGSDGLGFSFAAEIPHNKVIAERTEPHTRVFDEDCLEVFIQPSAPKTIPAPQTESPQTDKQNCTYYCWEINPNGACLDYCVDYGPAVDALAGTTEEEHAAFKAKSSYTGQESVRGKLYDFVAEKPLFFDYDRIPKAKWVQSVDDEFWYLELFVPYSSLGLSEPPKAGDIWKATFNRIDAPRTKPGQKKDNPKPGLASLLEDTNWPKFHQPEHFAELVFTE